MSLSESLLKRIDAIDEVNKNRKAELNMKHYGNPYGADGKDDEDHHEENDSGFAYTQHTGVGKKRPGGKK